MVAGLLLGRLVVRHTARGRGSFPAAGWPGEHAALILKACGYWRHNVNGDGETTRHVPTRPAAFEINRIYNILEKAFERLCESFENHLEKTGRYHDTPIERMTLDLKGIRPAFLPLDAVRDVRELKGFGHLFRHAYDLDLDPIRVTAAAENASRCVAGFDGWCRSFLAEVRRRYGDQLE